MAKELSRGELVSEGNLTVPEAARLIRLSRSQLYALMSKGELPFIKIGKRRLVPRRALLDLMERNLVGAPAGDVGLPATSAGR